MSSRIPAGTRIGNTPWFIIGFLGEGGFAEVYECEHETLHKRAACKLAKPLKGPNAKLARDKALFAARLLARKNHPNLPDVYDAGMLEGDPPRNFTIMEILRGKELDDLLGEGRRLDVDQALRYAQGVADGVAEAATDGVIHRDIKPANIFVTDRDEVLVLDFDCARLPGSDTVAETGVRVGTPNFMSPEHWKDHKDLDARTDVWALGVVLYQMLSGRLPFTGGTMAEVFSSIIQHEPPSLASEVGAEVWALVEKSLRKNREERYRDMADFAAHIQALRQQRGTGEYLPTQRLTAESLPGPQTGPGHTVMGPPPMFTPGTAPAVVAPAQRSGASTPLLVAVGGIVVVATAAIVVALGAGAGETDPAAAASAPIEEPSSVAPVDEAPEPASAGDDPPGTEPVGAPDPEPDPEPPASASSFPASPPPPPPPPFKPSPSPQPGKVKW